MRPLEPSGWNPPRMSLAEEWAGECCAAQSATAEVPDRVRQDLCNSGYARGQCERFPGDSQADAVRFSLVSEAQLVYVLEKDHAPVEYGQIDIGRDPREPLVSQARAFLESYRRLTRMRP